MNETGADADVDVAIVGAGIAGLACALTLTRAGQRCVLFEAADVVGGRVRTERVEGFQLDVGFQILLTGYPTLGSLVDFGGLETRAFLPGAMIRRNGTFSLLADPLRAPRFLGKTLRTMAAMPLDAWRVLRERARLRRADAGALAPASALTTAQALRAAYSEQMVASFWRPFLRGVFLDPMLDTSADLYAFLFRMFASGESCVPSTGMAALPIAMARQLPADAIRLSRPVARVTPSSLTTQDGTCVPAKHVVVAADGPSRARLLGEPDPGSYRGGTTLWFAAEKPPPTGAWLVLNGQGGELVNHLAVLSEVAPGYAPAGQALIAANLIGIPAEDDAALVARVVDELVGWFGDGVRAWRCLRVHRIPEALPAYLSGNHPSPASRGRPPIRKGGVWFCGDYLEMPSLEGAARSGVRTANAILDPAHLSPSAAC